jgi:hypothetical protein
MLANLTWVMMITRDKNQSGLYARKAADLMILVFLTALLLVSWAAGREGGRQASIGAVWRAGV